MTDEELAALRARLRSVEARSAATIARYAAIKAREDEALLAEVQAWRAIGRAAIAEPFNDGAYQCRWCGLSYVMGPDDAAHAPDCPLTVIPTLLGEGEA